MIKSFLKGKIDLVLKKIEIRNLINQKVAFFKEKNINSNEKGITLEKYFNEEVIISLTTYGIRIETVYLTIESLFHQTARANKIILWLDEEEFNEVSIPYSLKKLTQRGLTIKFCKNIRSYKKLIPTLKLYPEEIIITVDDDVLYPEYLVENFLKEYKKDKNNIYFYRGHRIKFKGDKLEKYQLWELNTQNKEASYLNFPTGVGGILYPPNCFYKDILEEELFMSLSPLGDDIWFKAMSLLKDKKCKKVDFVGEYIKDFISIDYSQEESLTEINMYGGKNDEQLEKVFKNYDKLYYKLLEK